MGNLVKRFAELGMKGEDATTRSGETAVVISRVDVWVYVVHGCMLGV